MKYQRTRINLLLKCGILTGAMLVMPLFQIQAQPSDNTKSVLREVVEIKESRVDSIKSRKTAILKIIELSVSEVNDLIKQLSSLKRLDVEYLKIRNQMLALLESYLKYLDALSTKLEKAETLEEIASLANEFKAWRENHYNVGLKKIINFVLVFQEKATLKTANARFDKIASDLNKLRSSKIIKTEQLLVLLNEAADHLKEAQLLNDQAQLLFVSQDSNQIEIGDLIEGAFTGIKAAYKSFFEMSALLKEMLGL